MRTPCLKALAGLFLASCLVTPVMAETLSDALRQAYDESPRLESERARLRATDELVPQALSGWRPLVRATSGYTIDRQQDEGPYVPRSDAEGNSDGMYSIEPSSRGGMNSRPRPGNTRSASFQNAVSVGSTLTAFNVNSTG